MSAARKSYEKAVRDRMRKRRKRQLLGPKPTLHVAPNVVDCLHNGALLFGGTCFVKDKTLVHVECWRAHFKVPGDTE